MRGDSLRDFYAKTLAVLGLGLLAGAGAAVDYWPIGSPVPTIGSANLAIPDVPVLSQRFDQDIPRPVQPRAVYFRSAIPARNVGSARFLTPVLQTTVAEAASESSVPAAVPDVTVPVHDVLWAEVLADGPALEFVLAGVVPPANAAPASGLIGGALRKTKDSLVRTGAVTGATIADAFKGVVGAFKKVSPF